MSDGTAFQHSAMVNQATGMVSVQAACSMDDALALLSERAAAAGETLDEIASAVLGRTIRFGE